MSNTEVKQCQNCKQQFTIEPEDFDFYGKMKVPAPTFCPECRMVRKMLIRNERSLYKQRCNLCNKDMVTTYSPDKPFKVYCIDCWWSDKWDPLNYGQDYDFIKPFFGQFKEMFKFVPRANLYQTQVTDSEYSNYAIYLKNCYLVFGGHHYEDSSFSAQSSFVNDSLDILFGRKAEFCYESIDITNCTNVFFSNYAENCSYSSFLFNCRNLNNCFGCVNLRNKSYHIFNKPYSKEEYDKKIKELDIGSYKSLVLIKDKIKKLILAYPRQYAMIRNSVNAVGDNIYNSKNCYYCFDVYKDIEDCRYSFFLPDNNKDLYDCDHTGISNELIYECMSISHDYEAKFGNRIYQCQNIYYSDDCHSCYNLFGCISLRNKQYCILNKQYSQQEYEQLVPKIIQHMNDMPYKDKKGRVYKYGEFFPSEISPFAYNETVAQEYFPLTKQQAIEQGYLWKDPERKEYEITVIPEDLPDHIKDVNDDILKQVIGCEHKGKCNEQCTTAFKIIPDELQFYQKMNLSLPRLCPNCRHYQRLKQRNPLKLWHRKCQCDYKVYKNTGKHRHHLEGKCPNEFETSFSPERKEIVYCEACYQSEVV